MARYRFFIKVEGVSFDSVCFVHLMWKKVVHTLISWRLLLVCGLKPFLCLHFPLVPSQNIPERLTGDSKCLVGVVVCLSVAVLWGTPTSHVVAADWVSLFQLSSFITKHLWARCSNTDNLFDPTSCLMDVFSGRADYNNHLRPKGEDSVALIEEAAFIWVAKLRCVRDLN